MNNYQILGLSNDASKEDIKKAYRRLALIHHPDKGGDNAKFVIIKRAYDELMEGNTGVRQPHSWSSVTVAGGKFEADESFTFNFITENIAVMIGDNMVDSFIRIPEKGSYKLNINIRKPQLILCNYYVELTFFDWNSKVIHKEFRLRQPVRPVQQESVKNKIINFFKGWTGQRR